MNVREIINIESNPKIDLYGRIGVFIDGSSLRGAARALGFEIDYRKLLAFFSGHGQLVRAYYYTATTDEVEYSPLRPLVDWLEYNGYAVVTKAGKDFIDHAGRRKIKSNMEIELVVDVLEMAPHLDHVVLFSGEGSFRRLVEQVQRKGIRVTVISTFRSVPPVVADDLRRQADAFLDLQDLAPVIARGQARRDGDSTTASPAITTEPES